MAGAKLARRCGDLDAARAWLLQLELTPAVVDAGLTCVHEGGVDSRGSLSGGGEGGGDGGGSLFEAARRWQVAKVLWAEGAHDATKVARALGMATALHDELAENAKRGGGGGSEASWLPLRVRVARTLGAWLDVSKAASSNGIQDMLQASVRLAGNVDSTAEAKALYALGCFYEGQYATVAREAADTVVKALDTVRRKLRLELATHKRESKEILGILRGDAGAKPLPAGQEGKDEKSRLTKLRSGLEHKIEELQKKLALDEPQAEAVREMGAHLKHALHHYIRCLQKAPAAADGMRARAAAAACRLWLNHPKDAALSTSLSELLRCAAGARGELPPEFVAYVPQLTSRLGSDEACDEFAAALHRLLEGAAASAGGAQAVGFELCALRRDETEPLRAAAAEKLFTRLRSRAPHFTTRSKPSPRTSASPTPPPPAAAAAAAASPRASAAAGRRRRVAGAAAAPLPDCRASQRRAAARRRRPEHRPEPRARAPPARPPPRRHCRHRQRDR